MKKNENIKNAKNLKKAENLSTNCTENITQSKEDNINLEHYQSNKQSYDILHSVNEENKNNTYEFTKGKKKLVLVENDNLEKNIILSIQHFGTLLHVGNFNLNNKIEENNIEVVKLNSMLNSLKSNNLDSSQQMIYENNIIKREIFINENYNKKRKLREESSLFNTIKKESIINGIYLNSDMRIKKYSILFDFLTENLNEINNFLTKPQEINQNAHFSPSTTLRIIEKTASNIENNKGIITNNHIVSDTSLFNETDKLEYLNKNKKSPKNKNFKENTSIDYDCSDMQENAVINKPSEKTPTKINLNETNNFIPLINSFERKNSFLDLLDEKTINSELCKNGVLYDDDKILKNLDLDMISNYSSKNVSRFFHLDSLNNNEVKINLFNDEKDGNTTLQFNNFLLNNVVNRNSIGSTQPKINNIKNKLNLDKTYKMDEYDNSNSYTKNENLKKNEKNDQTIINNHFEIKKENVYVNNIKIDKNQK